MSEAKKYFKEHGFEIEEVTYAKKLPQLTSLNDNSDDLEKLRKAYESIIMWVMTVKDGEVKNTDEGKEFDVQWERDGSTLVCKITGRLDTITGPELLSEYREQNTDGVQEIIMDLADTEYISSAGLRVINIMSESLPDPDEFRFKNVTEDVMDILEVTGFADVYEII